MDHPTKTIAEGTRVQTKDGVVAVAQASSYIARNGKEMVELKREGDTSKRWFRSQVATLTVLDNHPVVVLAVGGGAGVCSACAARTDFTWYAKYSDGTSRPFCSLHTPEVGSAKR